MRAALSGFLLEAHWLLRDATRHRGSPPGSALERDLEAIATARWLRTERRVRRGPHGGIYYSGLSPETDLFVYDGPEFLQIEAKDLSNPLSRVIATEFWARALDLHLGRARDSLPESRKEQFPVLVIANHATDELRGACIRWGICLLEPGRLPLPVLASRSDELAEPLRQAGCNLQDLRWAALPYNDRFPRASAGVLFPFGPLRSKGALKALLQFQQLATQRSWRNELRGESNACDSTLRRSPPSHTSADVVCRVHAQHFPE